MEQRTAIIFGATGLIGSQLLSGLLASDSFSTVKAVVRRTLPQQHPKLRQIIGDYESLSTLQDDLNADIAYCCLGTTRKKTPDKKAYYQVDHDYPVLAGRLLKEKGTSQFHFISSICADEHSGNFYLRTKGETERDLRALKYASLYIYRPSLLTGHRNERRLAETVAARIMSLVNPLLTGNLKKYRSIPAAAVADTMIRKSKNPHKGIFIIEYQSFKGKL
jgi:uncharacterized protein YbjT (DUF2867 family)